MRKFPRYRILMFAPAFAPFANPEAIVNSKLALAFLDAGWEVDVISRNLAVESKYNYGSGWTEPWVPLKEVTYMVRYPLENRISRLFQILLGAIKTQYLIDGCRWASCALDLSLKLHKQKHFNIIISRSGPDSAHLAAMAFARRTGIPWIANWNDPTGGKTPEPYGRGLAGKASLVYERFLHKVVKEADWFTFPADRLKNYISIYLGAEILKKYSVIPHVAIHHPLIEKSSDRNIFTLCHAGHLSKERNPKIFLKALAMFIDQGDIGGGIKFNLIGIENVDVTNIVRDYGLQGNIVFKGSLNYSETLSEIYSSNVAVVIEASSREGIFLPSKFIDYVQTGRPILAVSPKSGTLNDIISNYGGGIAVDCHSAKAILDALIKLYSYWEKNTLDEQYGSYRLYNIFSPETVVDKYKKIFLQIGLRAL